MNLHKTIGVLARQSSLSDPHTPVWVPGFGYPVQYIVRQTRSMSSQSDDSCRGNDTLIVSIPLSKLPIQTPPTQGRKGEESILPAASTIKQLLKPLDFFLPDDIFLKEKLLKLREVERWRKTNNTCSAADNRDHTHFVPLTTPTSVQTVLRPTRPSYECYCHGNQYSQQWANNNSGLSYLSAVNTTANGQPVLAKAGANCSPVIYQENNKSPYVMDTPLNESLSLALKLLKIGTSLFLIFITTKQLFLWELSQHTQPVLLIKEEINHTSNSTGPSPYPVHVKSHLLSDGEVYISFIVPSCDGDLKLLHLSNDANKQWQVVSCDSYNDIKLSTICSVCGDTMLLLGITIDGPIRLLLYNVEMGVVTDSVPLTCPQPTLPVKPVKPVILVGAMAGSSVSWITVREDVILVVLCVYGRVWSDVAGWLVAWDTTANQSYWLIRYQHSPLLQNECEVVDWCYHGNQFSLLFSNNYISTWDTDRPHPLRHTSND